MYMLSRDVVKIRSRIDTGIHVGVQQQYFRRNFRPPGSLRNVVSLQGLRDLPEKSHQPGFAASRSKANAPLKQEQSVPRVLLPDAGYDHREVNDPHTNKSAFDYEHTGPFNFSLKVRSHAKRSRWIQNLQQIALWSMAHLGPGLDRIAEAALISHYSSRSLFYQYCLRLVFLPLRLSGYFSFARNRISLGDRDYCLRNWYVRLEPNNCATCMLTHITS
jgi:hypothetical protein